VNLTWFAAQPPQFESVQFVFSEAAAPAIRMRSPLPGTVTPVTTGASVAVIVVPETVYDKIVNSRRGAVPPVATVELT
jgi:hypothetical protein